MFETRLYDRMKEKQKSQEKLAYTKTEKLEKAIFEITKKLDKIEVADEVSCSKNDRIKTFTVKKKHYLN